MKAYQDKNVISGTWGEVWINSTYVAETKGMEAKVTFDKEEIVKAGRMTKGYKVVAYEGKGVLKLNKVSSLMIELLSDDMKKGKQTVATIVSKLKDPDAFGCERIKLSNVTFDELTLVNWEAKKVGEESIPFTFTDWDPIDIIKS